MKVELRNFKHAPFLSEETEAFKATVYVDNIALFIASNDGKGGSNSVDLLKGKTQGDLIPLREWVTKLEGFEKDRHLDFYLSVLVSGKLREIDLSRLLKRRVVYFSRKSEVAGLRQFSKAVAPKKLNDSHRAELEKHDPGSIILNDIDTDEAIKFYAASNSLSELTKAYYQFTS